jgi:hypothetical protein
MSRRSILDEQKLNLQDARPHLGTARKPADFSTVWRAVTRGTILPDGTRLKLDAVRIGGQWITSVEAIERYVMGLTAAWTGEDVEPAGPSQSQRRARELARVDRELEAVGIPSTSSPRR